jgi:uncharacterized membrane protein
MIDVAEHGWLLFLVTLVALWLTARVGALAARRHPLPREMRPDFNVLQGAALTLLALIIGFSFAMASTRYDQRKNLEEAEANAIGTEYFRAALLPSGDADKVRALLKAWLDLRMQFYTATGADNVRSINERAAKLQADLWAAVLPAANAAPTPITALAVAGMNDVLNAQGYTEAAWLNRIPPAAWTLMGAIALCCNLLVGYGMHGTVSPRRLSAILPFFTAIAFAFIADIDSPRHGIILVKPVNLISLSASLPAA